MLQTLREKPIIRKVVLTAVLIVMVLGIGVGVTAVFSDLLGGNSSGTGMSTSQGWAMTLGPDTISPAQFQQELRFVSNEANRQGGLSGADFQALVKRETVQRLARRTLEVRAAREAGLTVSDREVSDSIVSMPDFQRNGSFIGAAEYQRVLDREGIDVTTFENRIRDGILCEKWENLVRAGAVVTESEVDEEMAHRNQKIKFDYVVVGPDKFPPAAQPSEAEIKSWYEGNPDRYQRGEARRVKYVVLDTKEAEKQVTVSDDEVRKLYEANAEKIGGTFDSKKDEVRSQVAFSKALEETDRQAAVFKANIKAAADLDPAAAKKGLKVIDTGLIRREDPSAAALGPEFQHAIFSPTPGEAAGQARTTTGSAVFVLLEAKPAGRATLDEARADIISDLKKDKGRQAAMSAARQAVAAAGSDLEAVAKKLGATVQSSPLVSKGEPVPSLGYEPAVESAAFAAPQGKIADPVATAGGSVVVLKVAEKTSPEAGANPAARDQVRTDLRHNREAELLQSILESAYKKTELKTNEDYIRQFGS